MASSGDERESPAEATDRRRRFALSIIEDCVRSKFGNPSSFGEFKVSLRWKAGILEQVIVADETSYK